MYGDNQYQQFNNMPYDNTGVQPAAPQDNRQAGNGPEKPESRKKKDSVWRKLGVSAACALVFGCVAGVRHDDRRHEDDRHFPDICGRE